jgi:hypothetical protein
VASKIATGRVTFLLRLVSKCSTVRHRRKSRQGETTMSEAHKFNGQQIEDIIERVVPLIAAPKDHEFFRGVLHVKADSCRSSGEFAYFINRLLAQHNPGVTA